MTYSKNIHRITKYFLFSVLFLFPLCVAQDEIELNLENHDGISWKPPRRHLLWHDYSSSSMSGPEVVVYVIAVIIITLISVCCKYCIKQGCEPTSNYSDAVLHPPPRTQNLTVPVAPSRRVLNPPRSSGSIILPPEDGVFSIGFTGIENPNYYPSNDVPVHTYYPPTVLQFTDDTSNENPTPILDLPPSYESVIKEQKFPKVN